MNRSLRLSLLVLLLGLCLPRSAWAIPAFARRYETSCQTCHLAYPALTPFGEAFRWNGYRFPDKGDLTAEKQPPVELGNEAQKERWPKVVYPGAIPAEVPLSITLSGSAGYGMEFEGHDHEGAMAGMEASEMSEEGEHMGEVRLSSLVDMFGLRAAASLGDHFSVLTAVNLGGMSGVELERASLTFEPLADPTRLRIKVGAFEPELHGISIHRGLVGHMLRLTTATTGDATWAPEPTETGLELSGVAHHRVGWVVGAVENVTPAVYMEKDAYVRGFWKLGGMPVDGSGATSSSAAWRERSFTLGASAYNGREQLSDGARVQDDSFTRVGLDAHTIIEDLSLHLVTIRQWNDKPYLGDSESTVTDRAFVELTYVTLPVFFPTARFEASHEQKGEADWTSPDWLGMLALSGVVRPNVLLRAQGAVGGEPGEATHFRFATLSYAAAF